MPSSRNLPNPGIEPRSSTLQVDSLPSGPPGKPKNTGVGSLSLLQGNLPDPGIKLGSLHCRWLLYQLSHQGSPRILEWVACSFSRGTSHPRNQTGVSCIAGRFFSYQGSPELIPYCIFESCQESRSLKSSSQEGKFSVTMNVGRLLTRLIVAIIS